MDAPNPIPYGYCHCGCGERTMISPENHTRRGYVKGQRRKYVVGHAWRRPVEDYFEICEAGYSSPCWIWHGRRTHNGYGQYAMNSKRRSAHVVIWERANGPVPDGLDLDHLCRNRACVNPEHLEPVTRAENIRRGAHAKLTVEDVQDIRRRAAEGESRRVLREEFGVSKDCIKDVILRRNWRDV